MREEMGEENIFIFGMTVDEVEKEKAHGWVISFYINMNTSLTMYWTAIGYIAFETTQYYLSVPIIFSEFKLRQLFGFLTTGLRRFFTKQQVFVFLPEDKTCICAYLLET